jgi:hypothetical protein
MQIIKVLVGEGRMLFRQDILQGIAEGRVMLAFDPRIALRKRLPEHAELEAIVARLARVDAASWTPWTRRYLELIADQPGIGSRVLAPQVGAEVPPFKRRVRQLKELGLTESLEIGYRLSPRGRAVLERLISDPPPR